MSKGVTSKRTILFRQNINRTNEEWAHFLEGYRDWLMEWDMKQFDDDWHTAEDIASEIFLSIILEPMITNLRPDETFRHTLLTLCKQKHRDVVKPWRKGLASKLCEALHLARTTRSDFVLEAALGFADLVEADLMDETRDGGRDFKDFSKEDLKRWRKLHLAQGSSEEKVNAKDVAKINGIGASVFSRSCVKVTNHVVKMVKEILKRRGFRG